MSSWVMSKSTACSRFQTASNGFEHLIQHQTSTASSYFYSSETRPSLMAFFNSIIARQFPTHYRMRLERSHTPQAIVCASSDQVRRERSCVPRAIVCASSDQVRIERSCVPRRAYAHSLKPLSMSANVKVSKFKFAWLCHAAVFHRLNVAS